MFQIFQQARTKIDGNRVESCCDLEYAGEDKLLLEDFQQVWVACQPGSNMLQRHHPIRDLHDSLVAEFRNALHPIRNCSTSKKRS